MIITLGFTCRHRGFELGYEKGLHGYRPAWRSSLEDEWTVGCVYSDDLEDCQLLARECIDFRYREAAAEAFLGRKLTMEEICKLKRP